MAWDFSTDPEYQRKLDWARDFVRTQNDRPLAGVRVVLTQIGMPLGVVGGVTFAILAHFDVPSTLWLGVAVGFAFSWPLLDIKDRQVVRPRFQLSHREPPSPSHVSLG